MTCRASWRFPRALRDNALVRNSCEAVAVGGERRAKGSFTIHCLFGNCLAAHPCVFPVMMKLGAMLAGLLPAELQKKKKIEECKQIHTQATLVWTVPLHKEATRSE